MRGPLLGETSITSSISSSPSPSSLDAKFSSTIPGDAFLYGFTNL
jgi:hypothetical protein